jgi:hypothetical protein
MMCMCMYMKPLMYTHPVRKLAKTPRVKDATFLSLLRWLQGMLTLLF